MNYSLWLQRNNVYPRKYQNNKNVNKTLLCKFPVFQIFFLIIMRNSLFWKENTVSSLKNHIKSEQQNISDH